MGISDLILRTSNFAFLTFHQPTRRLTLGVNIGNSSCVIAVFLDKGNGKLQCVHFAASPGSGEPQFRQAELALVATGLTCVSLVKVKLPVMLQCPHFTTSSSLLVLQLLQTFMS